MKKWALKGLAFAAAMSLAVNVFAAEADGGNDGESGKPKTHAEVIGNYQSGEAVFKVDIAWGSMDFTYQAASKGTWDTQNYVYTNPVEAKWTYEEGANEIKIINHSNREVIVNMYMDYIDEAAKEANLCSFLDWGSDTVTFVGAPEEYKKEHPEGNLFFETLEEGTSFSGGFLLYSAEPLSGQTSGKPQQALIRIIPKGTLSEAFTEKTQLATLTICLAESK